MSHYALTIPGLKMNPTITEQGRIFQKLINYPKNHPNYLGWRELKLQENDYVYIEDLQLIEDLESKLKQNKPTPES